MHGKREMREITGEEERQGRRGEEEERQLGENRKRGREGERKAKETGGGGDTIKRQERGRGRRGA
jgi:hypothetical protein